MSPNALQTIDMVSLVTAAAVLMVAFGSMVTLPANHADEVNGVDFADAAHALSIKLPPYNPAVIFSATVAGAETRPDVRG